MSDLLQILQEYGLTPNEAKLYLANLELGATTVQDIAKKSKLKRTTIYSLVNMIKQKGLISEFRHGAKTYLVAEDPAHLQRIFEERYQRLQEAIPEFRSLYNTPTVKPKIRFYEGKEGIRLVYEDTLDEQKEILCFVGWHSMMKAMPGFGRNILASAYSEGFV